MKQEIRIVYISSSGVMLCCNGRKILIDALHTEAFGFWSGVPDVILEKILRAKAPFNQVELLLFTHNHRDHCSYELVRSMDNQDIPVISPEKIKKQRKISLYEPEIVFHNELFEITAIETMHMTPYVDIVTPHFSYYIKIGDKKLFFNGDADIKSRKLCDLVERLDIDVLVINYVEINRLEGLDFIRKKVQPERVILCHLPLEKDDQYHSIKMTKRKINEYGDYLPCTVALEKPMQTIII